MGLLWFFFFLMMRRAPRSTLFPYTPLFRSVQSRRGPQGGHALAMDPKDINLNMVMERLDSSNSPLDCLINPHDCVFSHTCAQQEVWQTVEATIRDVLSNITLADLAERQSSLAEKAALPVSS